MLKRETLAKLFRVPTVSVLGAAALFMAAGGVGVAIGSLHRPAPLILAPPAVLPPAQVLVVVPPSVPVLVTPPPAPPPPPPAIPLAPPTVGLVCPKQASLVGMPIALADTMERGQPSIDSVLADPEGCALAVVSGTAILLSHDGGQTFAPALDAPGDVLAATLAAGRLLVVRGGGLLGVSRPGQPDVWRKLPFAPASSENVQVRLTAAGSRTGLVVTQGDTAVVAISDDDGGTWRYLPAPPKSSALLALSPGGDIAISIPFDGNDGSAEESYAFDLGTGRWHKRPGATAAAPGPDGLSYALLIDKFWGCGGTYKLVAIDHRGQEHVIDTYQNMVDSFPEVVDSSAGAFVTAGEHLQRLADGQMHDLGETPPGFRLRAVDASGGAIGIAEGNRLERYSASGGWRVLLQ